ALAHVRKTVSPSGYRGLRAFDSLSLARSGSSNFVEKSGTVSELAPACEIGEALFPLENPDPGGVAGWTATASSISTELGDWDAGHMIDNRVNTYWLSETNTLDPGHFITVDMGSTKTIAGLQYFYNDENSDGAIEEFEVLASTDGVNFIAVTTGQLATDVKPLHSILSLTPRSVRVITG
ncbi:discoidin domain-containing protein, partial [Solemya elarraichensis gill symbiont]